MAGPCFRGHYTGTTHEEVAALFDAAAVGLDHVTGRGELDAPPSHPDSYEQVFHQVSHERFTLPLRHAASEAVRDDLAAQRLERAIGVIYRPETERVSHYFETVLPKQFDEYIWFDETSAVQPLDDRDNEALDDMHPLKT